MDIVTVHLKNFNRVGRREGKAATRYYIETSRGGKSAFWGPLIFSWEIAKKKKVVCVWGGEGSCIYFTCMVGSHHRIVAVRTDQKWLTIAAFGTVLTKVSWRGAAIVCDRTLTSVIFYNGCYPPRVPPLPSPHWNCLFSSADPWKGWMHLSLCGRGKNIHEKTVHRSREGQSEKWNETRQTIYKLIGITELD